MKPKNAKSEKKSRDASKGGDDKSARQALYKTVTEAVNTGNEEYLDQIIAEAHSQGQLDENIIRIGLQQTVRNSSVPKLNVVIKWGEASGLLQRNDDLLRIALHEAAKLGNVETTKVLLEHGAKTDIGAKGSSALWWSVSQPETTGHIAVTRLLLANGADAEWRDDDRRTIFMSAAERGHVGSLEILLKHGVDFNACDTNDRTVIHILAALPEKKYKHNDKCLALLLRLPINVDNPDATNRTALHWAASTGKAQLIEAILSKTGIAVDPNCETYRGKTALHLACSAEPPDIDIIRSLLVHGASTSKTSDGQWTCVHHAAQNSRSADIIGALVTHSPQLLNMATSTGMTALHIAAWAGCPENVECLLRFKDIKINARDGFYWTPLLRAASGGHMEIVQQLAPYNIAQRLSEHALHASRGFEASIVDFRAESQHHTLVQKRTVYEVLYGKEPDNNPLVTTMVSNIKTRIGASKPLFRWIHLPANNIAWVEALIVKHFVESGSSDIDGFKEVERSFGEQHRGPNYHSHHMTPLCRRTPRARDELPDEAVTATLKQPNAKLKRAPASRSDSPHLGGLVRQSTGDTDSLLPARPSPKLRASHVRRHRQEHPRHAFAIDSDDSTTAYEAPTKSLHSGSNMVVFMPYLHYETAQGRKYQREAVERAGSIHPPRQPTCEDEALIFGHLQSTTGLHLRRTLYQYYLYGVDTDDRDLSQVVGRYHRAQEAEEKLFMVDQLWIWVLGPELIVTSFPRRWRQPKNDPLDVLDGIVQDVNSGMGTKRISSPYELVAVITARCSGVFDRHRPDDESFRFLEIFERSISAVTCKEPALYAKFFEASDTVRRTRKAPLEGDHESVKSAREYEAVEFFFDIGEETELLREIRDIREELRIIAAVLTDQETTLAALSNAVCEEFTASKNYIDCRESERKYDEQKKLVRGNLNDIDHMSDMAYILEEKLLDLLDLKQKQSNAYEARYTRDQQAAGIVRQGQITLIFTLVTIIFLPVSFMASFFAIPIAHFPGTDANTSSSGGNTSLPLGYVAKYTFGIGLGISFLIITLAFNTHTLSLLVGRAGRNWLPRRFQFPWQRDPRLVPYPTFNTAITGSYILEEQARAGLRETEVFDMMGAPSLAPSRSRSLSFRRSLDAISLNGDIDRLSIGRRRGRKSRFGAELTVSPSRYSRDMERG